MTTPVESPEKPNTEQPSRQAFLERQPTYWLKRSYQALRRRVDSDLRPLGITLSQRDALLALQHMGPSSHGELSTHLGLEQSSVSRLVEGLSKRRLVEIQEGRTDRRSRVVSLTDHGRQVLEHTPGSSQLGGSLLARTFSDQEMNQLIDLLRRSTQALEDGKPQSSSRSALGEDRDQEEAATGTDQSSSSHSGSTVKR